MNKKNKQALCILLVSLSCHSVKAQTLPTKSQIIDTMNLTNNYFMNKYPDPGADIITNGVVRPSNIWTRAVYYEGLMAFYKFFPDQRFLNYALTWGASHKWGLRDGNTLTRNADNQCCGQTYIDLYQYDPTPEKIEKIKASIDNMVNSTKVDDWWWIDALQMAMPVFARLGVLFNNKQYFEKMYQLYDYTKNSHGTNGLYNPKDHLWWRDADFDPPYSEPNGEDCYWSRGNGWVIAALARVLDILPKDEAHRNEYIQTFQDMASALKDVQRADGFWNVSLHDPNHYGGPETTGTAFFTYAIAWGINNGHLDYNVYYPVVAKAWNALADDAVHPNGFIGYVQGTGKEPSSSQPVTYDSKPDFDDYGLGSLLLAGSEVVKLAACDMPKPITTQEAKKASLRARRQITTAFGGRSIPRRCIFPYPE